MSGQTNVEIKNCIFNLIVDQFDTNNLNEIAFQVCALNRVSCEDFKISIVKTNNGEVMAIYYPNQGDAWLLKRAWEWLAFKICEDAQVSYLLIALGQKVNWWEICELFSPDRQPIKLPFNKIPNVKG